MKIKPIDTKNRPVFKYNPSFGYSSPLKTLYKKGKIKIKYGMYGGLLTKDNVSLEHLTPISKNGKTILSNLALVTKENNLKRGNQPLSNYINMEALQMYIEEMKKIKLKDFDGTKYVKSILRTITETLKAGK